MTRRCCILLLLVYCGACQQPHGGSVNDSSNDVAAGGAANGPALMGRVTTKDGVGIEGVVVQVYGGFATRLAGPQTVTDGDGRFRFAPLETGAWMQSDGSSGPMYYTGIRMEHDAFASVDGRNWWDVTVPIRDDVVYEHDVVMIPAGALKGRVSAVDGETPRAALDLKIHTTGSSHTTRYTTTDSNGDFEIRGLSPGDYTIEVNEPKWRYPTLASQHVCGGTTMALDLRFDPPVIVTASDD